MMKIVISLCFFIIILSVGCSTDDANTNSLSINDIQSDPLSFTGKLRINGVVSVFSDEDSSVFGIMDTAELLFCKDLYCGAFALPVRYVGGDPILELADEVDVIGIWAEYEDSIIFEVTDIAVKRNIMPLLTNNSSGGGS